MILLDRINFALQYHRIFKLWIVRLLFFIGIVTLVLILWGAIEIISTPYDGLGIYAWSGVISMVDPQGPTANKVFVGDAVQEFEKKVFQEGLSLYDEEVVGDEVALNIIRDDRLVKVNFSLTNTPLDKLISYLVPLYIGSLFSIISLILFSLKPWDITIKLFCLTSQLGAMCLVFGQLSNLFRPGFSTPFLILLALIGPLSLHFHVRLLALNNWKLSIFIRISYLISLFLISMILLFRNSIINNQLNYLLYRSAPISLIFNWVFVIFILLVTYLKPSSSSIKRVVRLVSVGGLFGIFPIVFFSLLPYYLTGDWILPVQYGFLLLGIIPMSYGNAILRHRLIQVEDRISRPATQILVLAIMFGLFLVIVGLINSIDGLRLVQEPILLSLVIVVTGSFFTPLRIFLNKLMQKLIYGGSYDYRSMVMSSAQELSNSSDLHRLTDQIISIFNRMHYKSGCIIRITSKEMVFLVSFGDEDTSDLSLPLNGALLKVINSLTFPYWREELLLESAHLPLTEMERAFLRNDNFSLLVPLKPRSELSGLLLLQPNYGKESMTTEDADILETLGALIAIAMDNVELLGQLQEKIISLEIAQDEVAESRQRLAVGRESERLFLARELHDGAIQNLHAIRMNLDGYEGGHDENEAQTINDQLLEVIYELRDLCANLRPPSLAHFGLKAALKSLMEDYETANESTNFWLDTQFNGFKHTELSELTIFRILQEGLVNVTHHAKAKNVWVRYTEGDPEIKLEIVDDGVGFDVPENLLEFGRNGHLGLLGIAERVESIGGSLRIISKPGKGSTISVRVLRTEILQKELCYEQ